MRNLAPDLLDRTVEVWLQADEDTFNPGNEFLQYYAFNVPETVPDQFGRYQDTIETVYYCKYKNPSPEVLELYMTLVLPDGVSIVVEMVKTGICAEPTDFICRRQVLDPNTGFDISCQAGWEPNGSWEDNQGNLNTYCCPVGWFICLTEGNDYFGMCVPPPHMTLDGQTVFCQ